MPSYTFLIAVAAATVSVAKAQVSSAQIEAFITAPNAVQRVNSLGPHGSTFDFGKVLNAPPAAGAPAGGRAAAATTANFLWGVNQGISMTVGLLEACGLNTPHSHPRSPEFLIPINGTLQTQMITENGAGTITETLQPLQGILYSQGSLHFQFNDNCDDALFVSGFRDSDPGTLSAAQRLFGLSPDTVEASLLIDSDVFQKIASGIPDTFALGAAECRKRCGLDNVTQPTAQLQANIDKNLAGAAASSAPAASSSSVASTGTGAATSAASSSAAAAPTASQGKREFQPVYLRKRD